VPRDMVQVRRSGQHEYRAPEARIGRSQFNRSHRRLMTFDASYLYPILVDEVLPGDTFTCRLSGFARIFSPLDSPVMDNIELETCFFFVPNRLVWDNWQYFQGEHDDAGAQDTDYTIPVFNTGITVNHDGSAYDTAALLAYMGVPEGLQTGSVNVNALPARCYQLIWAEWFRDQNLINTPSYARGNGPDGANYPIKKSAKKHDYFTSALPYLQKGDASTVALTGSLEVRTDATAGQTVSVWADAAGTGSYQEIDTGAATADISATAGSAARKLFVDLTAGDVDINALRQSVAIQRALEIDARAGTRYTEIVKARFGVTVPDYRVQRPEYLGGGKSYINISPVANMADIGAATSASGAAQYQGKLHGIGTGVISGHSWAKSFTEHGYIIGLVRARGDITYFQGLDRMWSRSTRYDFYEPVFAHLGEQSVLNKELYVSNSSATDDAVFGYQERWSEYRQKKSEIVGKVNPDVSGALSQWHLAEDFASLPSLNQTFVEDQTPMSRVVTVTTEPDFLLDLWFDYKCARPLPVFSVPALQGRF
jgi:hypothetical protein